MISVFLAMPNKQTLDSLSILIVDDCTTSRLLLRSVLSGMNLHATMLEAKTAESALDSIHLGFDIIFMDLQMPGMSGIEALQIIKLKTPEQFVAVISSEATSDNVKTVMQLGGDSFIAKPYTQQKIRFVIDRFQQKTGSL